MSKYELSRIKMLGAIIQPLSFTSLTPRLHCACTWPGQSQEQAEGHVLRPSTHINAAIRLPTAPLHPSAPQSWDLSRKDIWAGGWVAQAVGQLDAITRHRASRPVHVEYPCALKHSSAPRQFRSSMVATGLPQGYQVDTWIWPYRASRKK